MFIPKIDPSLAHWLEKIKKSKKRPLRVLHIGNIANNAYINAKIQRKIGIEAYVIAELDKYIMDTPEWEDADFEGGWGDDDFNPKWENVDLKGYQRPDWFITGTLAACLAKTKRSFNYKGSSGRKRTFKKFFLHFRTNTEIFFFQLTDTLLKTFVKFLIDIKNSLFLFLKAFFDFFKNIVILSLSTFLLVFNIPIRASQIYKLYLEAGEYIEKLKSFNKIKKIFKFIKNKIKIFYNSKDLSSSPVFFYTLNKEFKRLFPTRTDILSSEDLMPFVIALYTWKKIFAYFDLVQAYGIHPLFCLGSPETKYVALEHGTLRDFTLRDDPLCRLTSLGYRKALHTFITNGDCLEYAEKIDLKSYSPTIHPTDFEPFERATQRDVKYIRKRYKTDLLLFCPTRHDWDIKGTDIVIKALPYILKSTKSVTLLLSEWGKETLRSKALIKELNLEAYVRWTRPLPRVALAKHLKAADVTLDQMILPCFGGISPQSLAAGTPVIMSYKPESTSWMFPEPAPILPAFSSEEICEQVFKALDPQWRKSFKIQAKEWMEKYHSPSTTLNDHLAVYKKIL